MAIEKKSETDKSQGYILLHRKMMDKPYFTNSQIIHMWVYMLFKANHKDNYFEMKLVKRGSFATSRKRIAEDTGINESKVERILKMLENEQEIEQQNCGKFRIITIVDWDRFQKVNSKMNNSETMNEQQRNNSETMSEHNIIMNNNVSNENNDIKEIINYLNSVCGSFYKHTTKNTIQLIKARIKEGFTVNDFKIVIDKKFNEWNNTEHSKYLRPETLFGNKMEGYLNQQINKGGKNERIAGINRNEFASYFTEQ